MRGDSDFPYTNCLRVWFFQQKKLITFKFSQHQRYVKLLFCFVILFRFYHM